MRVDLSRSDLNSIDPRVFCDAPFRKVNVANVIKKQ